MKRLICILAIASAAALAQPTPQYVRRSGDPILDKGGQVFNVKAYGAKGDQVTDDTAALNSALAAAKAARGRLYFPCGIYSTTTGLETDTITSFTIEGANIDCAYISYTGTANVTGVLRVFSDPTHASYVVENNIRDLSIVGNAHVTVADLYMAWPTGSNVRNVRGLGANGTTGACFAFDNGVNNFYESLGCNRLEGGADNTPWPTTTGWPYDARPHDGIDVLNTAGSGGGTVPTLLINASVSDVSGTALNVTPNTSMMYISGCQISVNGQSLHQSGGNVHIDSCLLEAGTNPDVIDGGQSTYTNDLFTGAGLTISGNQNIFRGGQLAIPTITITSAAQQTVFDGATIPNSVVVNDSSNTTVYRNIYDYGNSTGRLNFPNVLETSIPTWGSDPMFRENISFNITSGAITVLPNKLTTGKSWKAIFIGNWSCGGTQNNIAPFLELTDTANVATVCGNTLTFTISAGGYFQVVGSTSTLGFTGQIYLIPRMSSPGTGGAVGMQLADGIIVPSVQIASGTAMTANHGTGTSVQHSDGTGASGNLARYAADGSVTDAGVAATAVAQLPAWHSAACNSTDGAACVKFTGQTGIINTTTLFTVPASGACSNSQYRLSTNIYIVSNPVASVTIFANTTLPEHGGNQFVGANGSTAAANVNFTNTTTAILNAGSNVVFSTSLSAGTTWPTYDVSWTLECLN
jgi:hypothetical protein